MSSEESDFDYDIKEFKNKLKGTTSQTNDNSDVSSNSDYEDNSSNSGGEVDEQTRFATLRAQIADMPFDEVQLLKQKIGLKAFNQTMNAGKVTLKTKKAKKEVKPLKESKKNEDSHRPMEISSKNKNVHDIQYSSKQKAKVHRDPRFDNLSGEYSEELFQKSYSFINDINHREKKTLMKEIRTSKDDERKVKIKALVSKMNESENRSKQKMDVLVKKRDRKHNERELISQGKKPFYLKKSDEKKLQLSEKYKELKDKGTLDKYMSKKRKKNAAKDRRNMPTAAPMPE